MSSASRAKQSGAMSIVMIAVFMPFLFFCFSLCLDIGAYYTDQAKVQAALDETALYAYRFLPNVTAAENAATAYAQRFSGLDGLSTEISDSTVLLRVNRRSNLTFAALVGVRDASLPLAVVSRVRGAPIDSFVVLDTSSAVAPGFGQTAWGASQEWPAAQYFDDVGGVSALAKTQRCFNPVFSALKTAAIDAYRYIGASAVNSVGLGFYSGLPSAPLFTARGPMALPSIPSNPPEVPFIGFADEYVGPSLCAAAAENEQATPRYQFPGSAVGLPSRGNLSGRPSSLITPGMRSFNPDYAPFLQGEELIWSQAASDVAGIGFSEALRGSLQQVLAAGRNTGRGGLVGKPARVLLWLAAQMPAESGVTFGTSGDIVVHDGIKAAFAGLAPGFGDTGLTIFYVIVGNPATSFAPDAASLTALRDALRVGASDAGIPDGVVTVRVLAVESPAQLTDQLARWMAIASKTTVVAL